MSNYNKKTFSGKLMLHSFLIVFSLVFIFPFLWMVCNSMKVREEMVGENFRLLPETPHVVRQTPYFDENEFGAIGAPEGIPAAVWCAVLPEFKAGIFSRLEKWRPCISGEIIPFDIKKRNLEPYKTAMTNGIIKMISARISDSARNIAANEVRKAENVGALSEEAIQTGKAAVLKDMKKLLNDEVMQEVFNRSYRRICLGDVKVMSGHRVRKAESVKGWCVNSDNAVLCRRKYNGTAYQMARIDYSKGDELLVSFVPEITDINDIDRIYVSFRSDASWARVYFEVVKNGKLYRTSDVVNLYNHDWTEVDLRWNKGNEKSFDRGSYYSLKEVGDVPGGGNKFDVRLRIERSNLLTAWWDKALRNYRIVFRDIPFARYIMTSLSLCIINIILAVFSCTFVAYAFARLEWPGRDLFFGLMVATMMVPSQVVMLPNFLINRQLGFYNSLVPLWLYSAFGSAFFIFLLRQFMKTIPKSLEEAAMMDGCGFLGIYWHVMLPLVKPTIATIAIYTFTGSWNNFMGPLIYVNDESLFPLALGLFKFNLVSGSDTGLMMAGSFMMTLPVIILFFFAQKYFIQGITLTGTKG